MDDWFNTSVEDESHKDLEGDSPRDMGRFLFGSPNGLTGLGIATTGALVQILGILCWCMQEAMKSRNQE